MEAGNDFLTTNNHFLINAGTIKQKRQRETYKDLLHNQVLVDLPMEVTEE